MSYRSSNYRKSNNRRSRTMNHTRNDQDFCSKCGQPIGWNSRGGGAQVRRRTGDGNMKAAVLFIGFLICLAVFLQMTGGGGM